MHNEFTAIFERDGDWYIAQSPEIVEKYDVRRREQDVSAGIRFGYSSNEIGFGWTNAAVLDLLAGIQRSARAPAAAMAGGRD